MTARVHVHLRTRDLQAARSFYTALLGAPDKELPDLVRFQPAGVPVALTLMPGEPAPPHEAEHFGLKWETVDDAKAAWARILEAGLTHDSAEENVACCAAVQEKRWYLDPDGRAWEVYAVTDDSLTDTSKSVRSGCCEPEAAPVEPALAEPATGGCCG